MDNQQKYLSGEKDATLFFDTFFAMCHKFKIDYEKASQKEKAFIDEMTRYSYELKKAKRDGLSTEKIEKPFPIEDAAENEMTSKSKEQNYFTKDSENSANMV